MAPLDGNIAPGFGGSTLTMSSVRVVSLDRVGHMTWPAGVPIPRNRSRHGSPASESTSTTLTDRFPS